MPLKKGLDTHDHTQGVHPAKYDRSECKGSGMASNARLVSPTVPRSFPIHRASSTRFRSFLPSNRRCCGTGTSWTSPNRVKDPDEGNQGMMDATFEMDSIPFPSPGGRKRTPPLSSTGNRTDLFFFHVGVGWVRRTTGYPSMWSFPIVGPIRWKGMVGEVVGKDSHHRTPSPPSSPGTLQDPFHPCARRSEVRLSTRDGSRTNRCVPYPFLRSRTRTFRP